MSNKNEVKERKKINVYLGRKWYDFLVDYCERNGLTMTTAVNFALMELREVDEEEKYSSKRELIETVCKMDEVLEEMKELLKECKGTK